jgi:hypothetical protein
MPDKNWIQQLVERVVSQALESHIPYLRDDLVRRVVQELQPVLASAVSATPAGPQASAKGLMKAISSIHDASTQKEILTALLEGARQFCGRTALFVVRSGAAVGWQARGFAKDDKVKNFPLDLTAGIAVQALQGEKPSNGTVADLDARLVSALGAPADEHVIMLPLIIKEKVAALLYADGGIEAVGILDREALELLVLSSGLWLEVLSLRRAAASGPSGHDSGAEADKTEPIPVQRAYTETVTAPMPRPVEMGMAAAAGAGSAKTATAQPAPPADDEEVHRKAQRFAKLLVDEIKLYNQSKVAEGRANKDLYDRVKEDIDKSRGAYEKRYGQTAAAAANYFVEEIVRNLAENNRSLLGKNFPL